VPRVLRAAQSRAGRPGRGTAPQHRVVRDDSLNVETAPQALCAYLTPAADRFLRSNFEVPRLSPRGHRLDVGGLVERPLRLRVQELSRFPQRTLTVTTECAGNHRTTLSPLPPGEPWSGGAVSTARWTGVPLAALLERAGLRPGAVEVIATGADSGQVTDGQAPYARSLPLARALHPDTVVALRMNGEPLLPPHGAPARLIVPGWYGMASVKWLARLELVAEPFAGYFQSERYVYRQPGQAATPVTDMRVKSVFTSPSPAVPVAMGPVRVGGFAWSGSARIARVEVKSGDGAGWVAARLTGDDEPYAWRAWESTWTPASRGRHVLRCRAADEAGNVQPDLPRWNELGYGANGVQTLVVEVF